MSEVKNLEQEEREETEEEREERLKREREERKRKRRRRIVTGAVILLLLCMACSMIAIALNPEVTEGDATEIAESVGVVDETAEPTETPEPTATEEPTETPSPTPTPTLTPSPSPTVLVTLTSTLTPTVTSTPEPTPENTPVGQVSMSEYREFVSDSSGVLGENMGGMSEQMGMVGNNPSLIRNDDWITNTAYYFAVLDVQAEEIINYTDEHTPPAQAMEFHEGYVEVAELLRQAIDIYIEGIDEMDPSKISQGNDLLGQAGAIINTLPIEDIAP